MVEMRQGVSVASSPCWSWTADGVFDDAAERLFSLIEQAKREGVGTACITHRHEQIKHVGDRVYLLRDHTEDHDARLPQNTSEMRLVELMTGRIVAQIFPKITLVPGRVLLRSETLTTSSGAISNVSISRAEAAKLCSGSRGSIGSANPNPAQACFGIEPIAAGDISLRRRAWSLAKLRAKCWTTVSSICRA